LIDNGFHAGRRGRNVLCGKASRVVRHLAAKSNDAVFGDDIHGGRFKKRLGIEFGFDAGGDGVIAWFIAGEGEQEQKRKSCEEQFPSNHEALQSLRRQQRHKTLRELQDPGPIVRCWTGRWR